ncbi:hypothetical protein SLEP1_g28288 [Rubroshorea leprosula]|uniref:Uncharacterized protein n=1 Tax=Rubroshorea leprosula TaxID=152421 RepID=A0AAV5K5J1_9ROSI|nr:hypothetical protein SLEP1_g28288 [Rubroshorea leprosula]
MTIWVIQRGALILGCYLPRTDKHFRIPMEGTLPICIAVTNDQGPILSPFLVT